MDRDGVSRGRVMSGSGKYNRSQVLLALVVYADGRF